MSAASMAMQVFFVTDVTCIMDLAKRRCDLRIESFCSPRLLTEQLFCGTRRCFGAQVTKQRKLTSN